jgi:NADH dehydrogenase FAD-containing subunit
MRVAHEPASRRRTESEPVDKRIVVIGGGTVGILVANRLHRYCGGEFGIVVVDRTDRRDQELELLVALGLYGPQTMHAPEQSRLRSGIDFRHVEVASVDLGLAEVCLTDGTTIHYEMLVVAIGTAPFPRGLGGGARFIRVDPRTLRSAARPDVFAVGAAAGLRPSAGPRAHVEAETVANGIRRLLTGHAAHGAGKVAFPMR